MNHNQEIPSFLLENVTMTDSDQQRLLLNLQLLALWKSVYPDKPYDHEAAVKLQIRLATQHVAHSRKEAEKRLKTQETNIKVVQSMRRKIAESVMRISPLSYDEKELSAHGDGFDTKITDALTGTNYGTIRSLLKEVDHITWEGCGDPLKDLEAFIENLKRYDDYTTTFVFDRLYDKSFKEKFSPRNIIYEVATFPKRPVENLKLTVTLKWKPYKNSAFLKRLKKQIREITPHVL